MQRETENGFLEALLGTGVVVIGLMVLLLVLSIAVIFGSSLWALVKS